MLLRQRKNSKKPATATRALPGRPKAKAAIIRTSARSAPTTKSSSANVHSTLRDSKSTGQSSPSPSTLHSFVAEDTGTDIGEDDEDDMDAEDIDKQLVMWAGRLELESIDLRDKSKRLTTELSRNSEVLHEATGELSNAIKSLFNLFEMQKASNCQSSTAKTNQKFGEIQSTLSKILKVTKEKGAGCGTLGVDEDIVGRIDDIEGKIDMIADALHKIVKIETVNKINNQVNAMGKRLDLYIRESKREPNRCTAMDEISRSLEQCAGRLEDITNLQIDFNALIRHLNYNQDRFKTDLENIKLKVSLSQGPFPLTPEPSITYERFSHQRRGSTDTTVAKTKPNNSRYKSQLHSRRKRLLIQQECSDDSAIDVIELS